MTMKKLFLLLLAFVLTGCSTVKIPEYIQDENPYTKNFFSSYPATLKAVQEVLSDLGWVIEELKDPSVYERSEGLDDPFSEKVLLITEVKEKAFVVGTRYSRLNVYVSSIEQDKTVVEVRFLTVTAMPYSSIRSYEHEFSAERILKKIEEKLSE